MPITTPKVPDGLPELMRGLAKSVIKENPENIYVHAAEYFENLVRDRDGELDREYKHFSAYKVYSDYKDKCRSRGGGNDGGSLSAGSVGDIPSSAGGMALRSGTVSAGDGDDDSGGSALATRGRRKKRVRKQGSKDSIKSVEKEESMEVLSENVKNSGVSETGSRQESLDAIKEDSPDLIEDAMVQVQVHQENQKPKESKPISKTVSVDSMAAANAVSSVLQDAVVESDEADRETGETIETQVEADLAVESQQPTNCEDLDSYPPDEDEDAIKLRYGEDYGSTPSTAEVTGEVVGEAEALDEDGPPINEEDDGSSEKPKETSDEVDQPVKDSFENTKEAVINGSIEEKSQISADRIQDSSEAQPEGIDTVDADNSTIGVDEAVLDLPNVPIEEPGSEGEKSVATEDVQVEPIVEEPLEDESIKDETKEELIEDANVIHSPKESSMDEPSVVVEKKSVDELTEEYLSSEQPRFEGDIEESQVQKSHSVDENAVQENWQEFKEETESKDENVEADGPSNSDDILSKEGPEDQSSADEIGKATSEPLEAESKPKSIEVTEETPLEHETNIDEEKNLLETSQFEENQEVNEEQVSSLISVKAESVEASPSTPQEEINAETIPESSKSVGETSPGKSSSIEEQDLNEKIPNASPEKVELTEDPPSVERPDDEHKSTGSAKESNEPSLDKTESEVNVESSEAENNPADSSGKEGSAEEPPTQDSVENPVEEPKSNGSAKSSNKSSNDEIPAAEVGSIEEPLSGGDGPKESVGSIDEPADQPKSRGSAKISKEPSQEKTESELNGSVDQSNAASKESSAKESEGDTSAEAASGQGRDGSVDAGEMSLSSRMGDDEEEAEPELESEHPNSMEKDDKGVEEPQNNVDDQVAAVSIEASAPSSEEATEPKVENKLSSAEEDSNKKSESIEEKADNLEASESNEEVVEEPCIQKSEESELKEEVVEEPCIQREISPSTSMLPIKQASVELEDIKKVDLASFNKDSAEALFYSLKKTELENQENPSDVNVQDNDDDDADVVVKDEPPPIVNRQLTKRGFTDDFLENSPITEEATEKVEGDGVDNGSEVFNPMMAARARNSQLLHQLHSRDDINTLETSPRKTLIRRCMTERVDLTRQDTNYVDLRKYDPDYVEEEDHFDGYYIGNIKHKILASSVSVADSDYYDPEQIENIIDENHVQTALETVASTDTESTLPSQTTIQANKGFLKRSSQNTSSNIPYASFGNNAINQSLDDFIEREEQMKEAEAQAASTIQRSYRRFQTNKRKLLRDYQSTMQTCTEDQSTESLEDHPNSVIQIKLDQKRQEDSDNSFEDARMENRRRPMYSLNIDEYDTVTRRMTLTRGVAMQRNSTPEEDSGKSDNVSSEKKSSASEPATNLALAEDSPISSSDLSEDKKSSTSGDEKENKDNSSSKSSAALKEPSGGMKVSSAALNNSGRQFASLDVQKLFIARQRTMPVQIETSVIRAQPKHMRKRIKSAGMIRK